MSQYHINHLQILTLDMVMEEDDDDLHTAWRCTRRAAGVMKAVATELHAKKVVRPRIIFLGVLCDDG